MLIRHSLTYILAKGLPGLINFISIAIFTRLLMPEEYGKFAMILAATELVNAIIFQWIRLSILRFLPAYINKNVQKFFSTLAISYLVIVLIMVGFGSIIWFALLKPEISSALWIMSICLLLTQSAFQINQELARTKLEPIKYGFLALFRAIFSLGLGVIFIYMGWKAEALLMGLILSMIIPTLWMIWREWFGVVRYSHFDQKMLFQLLIYGIPLTASYALNIFILSSDRILIGFLKSVQDAGFYASGYNLVQQSLIVLMIILNLASYPLVVRLYEEKKTQEMNQHLKQLIILLFGIALPAAIGISFLASEISEIFLGQQYREISKNLIPWFAFAILFMGLRSYYTDLAFQLGKRTIGQVLVLLIAAMINLTLNIWWIPLFGPTGAAYATILAYATGLLLSWRIGRKFFSLPFPLKELLKIVFAATIMMLALWLLTPLQGVFGILTKIFVGFLVYCTMIIVLNVGKIRARFLINLSQ